MSKTQAKAALTRAGTALEKAKETLADARKGGDTDAIKAAETALETAEESVADAKEALDEFGDRPNSGALDAQEVKQAAALAKENKLAEMKAEARKVKRGNHTHVVVKGKSVTTLRGIKAEFDGVSASSFSGKEGSLTRLVDLGVVEKA